MKSYFRFFTAFGLLLITLNASAVVRYVRPTSVGAGNGSSWTNASNDLQLMINNSSSGDEIWVAAGTYKPNRRADDLSTIAATNRNCAFVLKSGVKIYGGFPNNGTAVWTDRNWTANTTILSGDIGIVGNNTDNCYHVVISAGAVGTACLDGFTITGGNTPDSGSNNVNGQSVMSYYGGGMSIVNSSPTLTNLIISGNTGSSSAAGIYIMGTDSSPTLTNVTISGNTAGGGGSGLLCNWSSPTLVNVTISGNTGIGGGVYNGNGATPTFVNVTISGNTATGTASNDGGGGMNNSYSSPTLINVTISGNTSNANGGGILNTSCSPTLTNVTISGNTANNGGGMYSTASSPKLINVNISGNTANTNGGGIYNTTSSAVLTNVTISGNRASNNGGGIFTTSNTLPQIRNSIIGGNTAVTEGNNVYYFNNIASYRPVFTYSLVQRNSGTGSAWDPSLGTDGGNNLACDANPQFVSPQPASAAPTSAGNYRLQLASPSINTGYNDMYLTARGISNFIGETDLAGNQRLIGGAIDMGAYENPDAPTTINIAAILGVAVPATGATPVTTITDMGQYTGTVTWDNGNPSTFASGTVYTATITLTPKAGYTLAGVPANFFTVAGTSSSATNSIHSGVVTATFPATATPPSITSAGSTSVVSGTGGTFTVTAIGTTPITYSLTGQPAGVTINSTSGEITIAATTTPGVHTFTITASNGTSPDATQAFTLTVTAPPAITSANNTTVPSGTSGTFTVTATGTAPIAYTLTGAPTGVSINSTSGEITIASTTAAGTYTFTITANNGITPNATQTFTLTVTAPPSITSANNTTVPSGTSGTFTVTATGTAPIAYSLTGAPAGVTINSTSGEITIASTTAAGVYTFTITANNGITPNATQAFTLTITTPPILSGPTTMTLVEGYAATSTDIYTATGVPTATISKSSGHANITWNGTTQRLDIAAGLTAGEYIVVLGAANGVTPNATLTFTLTVTAPPVITSANSTSVVSGAGGTFTVTATGTTPIAYALTGAPAGVTINSTSGEITITATTAAGTHNFTITANNSTLIEATQAFTLTVTSSPTATSVNANATAPRVGVALTGSYVYNEGTGAGLGPQSGTTFKWYRSDVPAWGSATEISGANTVSYTPVGADVGKYLFFEVTPSNGVLTGAPVPSAASGQVGLVVSLNVTTNGTTGTATIGGGATSTVYSTTAPTLLAVLNNAASVAWTVSAGGGTFFNASALNPVYTLPLLSSVTDPIIIYATFTPTYTISVTNPAIVSGGTHLFTGATVGYLPITATTITISNTGSGAMNNLDVVVSGSNFTLDNTGLNVALAAGGTTNFTIKPNDGLPVGTYTATVTISDTSLATNYTFTVSFTVSVAPTYSISVAGIASGGTHAFTNAAGGYSPVTATPFTITSTGSGAMTNLNVSLTAGAGSFTLDKTGLNATLASGGTTGFTIKPNDNLSVGSHTATVTITDLNLATDYTFTLSFTVVFSLPVFDGLGDSYTAGAPTVTIKVKGIGSDLLRNFFVNGTSTAVFNPATPGVYLIEAVSDNGKMKIWKYVKVL